MRRYVRTYCQLWWNVAYLTHTIRDMFRSNFVQLNNMKALHKFLFSNIIHHDCLPSCHCSHIKPSPASRLSSFHTLLFVLFYFISVKHSKFPYDIIILFMYCLLKLFIFILILFLLLFQFSKIIQTFPKYNSNEKQKVYAEI